jgi:hypothetical protein
MQFVVATIYTAGNFIILSEKRSIFNFYLNSPNGYTCDTKAGRCNKGELSIPFYIKTESKPIEDVKDVPCPGGSSSCPDGNTCCQLSSGQWGW